jgi:hypothetical protein
VTVTLGQSLARDVELEPTGILSGNLLLPVLVVLMIAVMIVVVAVWRRRRMQTPQR